MPLSCSGTSVTLRSGAHRALTRSRSRGRGRQQAKARRTRRWCRPKPGRLSLPRLSESLPRHRRIRPKANLFPRPRPKPRASLHPRPSRPGASPRSRPPWRPRSPNHRQLLLLRTSRRPPRQSRKRRSALQRPNRRLLRQRDREPGLPPFGWQMGKGRRRPMSIRSCATCQKPTSRRGWPRQKEATPRLHSLNLRSFPVPRPASVNRVPGRFPARSIRPLRRGQQCPVIATDITRTGRRSV